MSENGKNNYLKTLVVYLKTVILSTFFTQKIQRIMT
jgi:hypothetical protein